MLWLFAGSAASAQTGAGGYDRAALTEAICGQYAAAQRAMPYETMYTQCMYARGYRVLRTLDRHRQPITHDSTKAFLEQSLGASRTIQPDKLSLSGKKAAVEGMPDKRVLSDATHNVELYRIEGNTHADGLIMKPTSIRRRPQHRAAGTAQSSHVNLYDNIERLNLAAIDQILPLHGRNVPLAELQKSIGKAS